MAPFSNPDIHTPFSQLRESNTSVFLNSSLVKAESKKALKIGNKDPRSRKINISEMLIVSEKLRNNVIII